MKNLTIRFTVMNNNNIYFATSLKAAVVFCNKNRFHLNFEGEDITPNFTKCGPGVYCILDEN